MHSGLGLNCDQVFSKRVPHLDGGVQRVLVEFLELGSDVQQIDLRPTHHDPVQSRLVCPTALTTRQGNVRFM